MALTLRLLADTYSWVSLPPGTEVDPMLITRSEFWSIMSDGTEVTLVCGQDCAPTNGKSYDNWRIFEVTGELAPDLVGIAASIAVPLANEKISIMPIATYRTDYIGVEADKIKQAVAALEDAGFAIIN